MKKFIFLILLFLITIGVTNYSLGSNLDLGVSINNGKLTNFYLSLGEYYRIPYDEIIIIKRKYPIIREEELPVLLLIVNYARVSPDIVIELRKKGWSWYEVMIKFGLEPEKIFHRYIVVYGPPYGKAYGYYKKPPKKIILKDYDMIELSHIKFFSEYYNKDPKIIIKLKEREKNYILVNEKLHHGHEIESKKHKEFKERKEFKNENRNFHTPHSHFR